MQGSVVFYGYNWLPNSNVKIYMYKPSENLKDSILFYTTSVSTDGNGFFQVNLPLLDTVRFVVFEGKADNGSSVRIVFSVPVLWIEHVSILEPIVDVGIYYRTLKGVGWYQSHQDILAWLTGNYDPRDVYIMLYDQDWRIVENFTNPSNFYLQISLDTKASCEYVAVEGYSDSGDYVRVIIPYHPSEGKSSIIDFLRGILDYIYNLMMWVWSYVRSFLMLGLPILGSLIALYIMSGLFESMYNLDATPIFDRFRVLASLFISVAGFIVKLVDMAKQFISWIGGLIVGLISRLL